MLGSIWRCNAGYTTDAFQPLSGKSSYTLLHSQVDEETVWARIQSCDEKNYAIMGSSNSHPNGDSETIGGIVQQHAYSILSSHEIDYEGGPFRILRMRNPWRTGEWEGAFSDKSDCWTDEYKEQLGFEDKDDGIFFIPFSAYMTNFDMTEFAMLL